MITQACFLKNRVGKNVSPGGPGNILLRPGSWVPSPLFALGAPCNDISYLWTGLCDGEQLCH